MKALDVLKVVMGIYSNKEIVKRFRDKSDTWAKLKEYDFDGLMKLCEEKVPQYYMKALSCVDKMCKQ